MFFLFVGIGLSNSALSQIEPKPFRNFLTKFTFSGSIGYGTTFSSNELSSGGLVQNPNSGPYLFDNTFAVFDTISVAYTNWVTNVQVVRDVPVDTSTFLLGLDSIPVTFKARNRNIPINIMVHYSFDRYRIGAGFSFEPYIAGTYKPNQFKDDIQSFDLPFNVSSYTRWFLMLGGEVFRSKRHMIVIDAKLGSYKQTKKHFNASQIKKGVFFNIGARFERSLSEYVKLYLRPSFEFKNYKLNFPESGYSVTHNLPAFYVSAGISWRLPDLNKCPIKSCKTQKHHHHGRKNYRSRAHPFWKWQNPDYGQNYPQLVKYKGKNKKRVNPY